MEKTRGNGLATSSIRSSMSPGTMRRLSVAGLPKNDELGTYRLPTEAEWEFACRGRLDHNLLFWRRSRGFSRACLVQRKLSARLSACGFEKSQIRSAFYDLYGNRQEWCQDVYAPDFYSKSPLSDPVCRSGSEKRVMRGGAHTDLATFCISARRWSQAPDNPGAAGIRVVCTPK